MWRLPLFPHGQTYRAEQIGQQTDKLGLILFAPNHFLGFVGKYRNANSRNIATCWESKCKHERRNAHCSYGEVIFFRKPILSRNRCQTVLLILFGVDVQTFFRTSHIRICHFGAPTKDLELRTIKTQNCALLSISPCAKDRYNALGLQWYKTYSGILSHRIRTWIASRSFFFTR